MVITTLPIIIIMAWLVITRPPPPGPPPPHLSRCQVVMARHDAAWP